MRRRLVITTIARVIAALFQALFFILGARWLLPADFGLVNTWISLGLVASVLAAAGIPQYILKARAEGDDQTVHGLLAASRVVTGLVIAVTIAGLLVGALVLGLSSVLWTAGLVILGTLMEKATDTRTSIALADQRVVLPGLCLVLRRAVALVLLWLMITVGVWASPEWFALSFAVGAASGFVTAVAFVRLEKPSTRTRARFAAWRSIRPYALASATAQGRSLDIPIVTMLSGPVAGGLYAAAYRIAGPSLLVATSISNILLPESARGSGASARRMVRVLVPSALFALVLAAGVGFAIVPLVPWALGDAYAAAAPVLVILLPAMVVVGLSSVLGSILQGRGYSTYVAVNGQIFLLGYLAILCVGVVFFGAVGAAFALLLAYLAKCASMIVFASRRL